MTWHGMWYSRSCWWAPYPTALAAHWGTGGELWQDWQPRAVLPAPHPATTLTATAATACVSFTQNSETDKCGQHYWVTANFMFFDRGIFWVLPLTYVYLPKSARAYLVPLSVEIHYFCSCPKVHRDCLARDVFLRTPSYILQSWSFGAVPFQQYSTNLSLTTQANI